MVHFFWYSFDHVLVSPPATNLMSLKGDLHHSERRSQRLAECLGLRGARGQPWIGTLQSLTKHALLLKWWNESNQREGFMDFPKSVFQCVSRISFTCWWCCALFLSLFFSENEWHFGHERRSVPFATTASLRVRWSATWTRCSRCSEWAWWLNRWWREKIQTYPNHNYNRCN